MEVKLDKYAGKKIAILGYGLEGKSAYKFFRDIGSEVYVYDEYESKDHPNNTTVEEAEQWELDDYDLVIRAPGISPHRISTSSEVSSVTGIIFEMCPAKIIGVTGTKGKGTTSTLISEILNASGHTVHLLGNIGTPAIDELSNIKPDDLVVLELSSFQLWDLKASPHIAVVLMIEPEHLDVHEDIDDYLDAKSHISLYQKPGDVTIFHPFNELSERVALNGSGVKKKYMSGDTARIHSGELVVGNEVIMSVGDFGLIGPHNRENICAAATATWEISQDKDALARAIKEFKGLEHRLEFVREVEGVAYYNDSFATTPAAAIAAISSFDSPEIIILGGSDKHSDYTDLAEAVSVKTNIKKVFLIGDMAQKINSALTKFDYSSAEILDGDMAKIVSAASSIAENGDVVLLSPACASFDMFKSYKDRGQQFKQAVKAL